MDISKLTEEQQAEIVEQYLGVHPKYFKFKGNRLVLDVAQMDVDGLQTHPDGVKNWQKGKLYQQHYDAGKIAINP